mgnify:CR=1 FL=1
MRKHHIRIIAGDNAKFGQPEINLGITPGFGGTQRLPRSVGQGWAKYLVLSGRVIRADEALRIGLVQAVFPRDELMTQAMKLAQELADKSPLAMRYCKAAVNAAAATDLATGQGVERDLFALSFATEDQTEGMAAFLDRFMPELRFSLWKFMPNLWASFLSCWIIFRVMLFLSR